jgi:hypothetical protein
VKLPDETMYLVVVAHPLGPFIPETDIDRTSLAAVTADLRDGQYKNPLTVLALDPVNHIFREANHVFKDFLTE